MPCARLMAGCRAKEAGLGGALKIHSSNSFLAVSMVGRPFAKSFVPLVWYDWPMEDTNSARRAKFGG